MDRSFFTLVGVHKTSLLKIPQVGRSYLAFLKTSQTVLTVSITVRPSRLCQRNVGLYVFDPHRSLCSSISLSKPGLFPSIIRPIYLDPLIHPCYHERFVCYVHHSRILGNDVLLFDSFPDDKHHHPSIHSSIVLFWRVPIGQSCFTKVSVFIQLTRVFCLTVMGLDFLTLSLVITSWQNNSITPSG